MKVTGRAGSKASTNHDENANYEGLEEPVILRDPGLESIQSDLREACIVQEPSSGICAKHANINDGNQQVNKGVSVTPPSDVKIINPHSELLKGADYERMDTGAAATAIVKDSAM